MDTYNDHKSIPQRVRNRNDQIVRIIQIVLAMIMNNTMMSNRSTGSPVKWFFGACGALKSLTFFTNVRRSSFSCTSTGYIPYNCAVCATHFMSTFLTPWQSHYVCLAYLTYHLIRILRTQRHCNGYTALFNIQIKSVHLVHVYNFA